MTVRVGKTTESAAGAAWLNIGRLKAVQAVRKPSLIGVRRFIIFTLVWKRESVKAKSYK